jgi:hypothetical protein
MHNPSFEGACAKRREDSSIQMLVLMNDTTPPAPRSRLHKRSGEIASGFDRILLYEFDVLKEHQTFAAKSLFRKKNSLDSEMKKMSVELDAEENRDYFDYMYDEYVTVTENLPRTQWYAQFLIVYSTFEHTLQELCRIVQRRSGFDLSFKDLEGMGITRARNYLVKVASVQPPFQSPAWNRALLLADVRNAIAHRNGEIEYQPGNKKSLSARLMNEKHLKLKQIIADQEDARIILEADFVRESIDTLRNIVADICNFKLYQNES